VRRGCCGSVAEFGKAKPVLVTFTAVGENDSALAGQSVQCAGKDFAALVSSEDHATTRIGQG